MFISYLYIGLAAELFALLCIYCVYLYVRNKKYKGALAEITLLWNRVHELIEAELEQANSESQSCDHQKRFLECLAVPFGSEPPGSLQIWRDLIGKMNVLNCMPAPKEREGEERETVMHQQKTDADVISEIEKILAEEGMATSQLDSSPTLGLSMEEGLTAMAKIIENKPELGNVVYLEEIQESMQEQQERISTLISEGKDIFDHLMSTDNAMILSRVAEHNQNLEALFNSLTAQTLLTKKYRNQATEFYVKFNSIRQEKNRVTEKHKALLQNCTRLLSRYNTLRLQYKKLYEIAAMTRAAAHHGIQPV